MPTIDQVVYLLGFFANFHVFVTSIILLFWFSSQVENNTGTNGVSLYTSIRFDTMTRTVLCSGSYGC